MVQHRYFVLVQRPAPRTGLLVGRAADTASAYRRISALPAAGLICCTILYSFIALLAVALYCASLRSSCTHIKSISFLWLCPPKFRRNFGGCNPSTSLVVSG